MKDGPFAHGMVCGLFLGLCLGIILAANFPWLLS